MRRLLAFILVVTLWLNFAPSANAFYDTLIPCSESEAFMAKAKLFRPTTDNPESGVNRAERYSQALCGPEGYPHLIVDGNLDHFGDFAIPSILFLYIAGWIGWVGRSYIIAVKKDKEPEMKEVIIDVPLAISKMLTGFIWPLAAIQEFTSGQLIVKNPDVPVSPR